MEHLIRFRTADGDDGTHLAATLTDAVAFIERLRNAEGATDVHLFRLTEVPLEFRPYYRVEVAGLAARPDDQPTPDVGPPASAPVSAPPAAAPSQAPAAVNPAPSSVPTAASTDGPSPSVPDSRPEPPAANGRRLFSRG